MSAKNLIDDVVRDSMDIEAIRARRRRLLLEVELEDRRAMRVDSNPAKSVWDKYGNDDE